MQSFWCSADHPCHVLLLGVFLQTILRRKAAAADSAEVLPGSWVVDRVMIGPGPAAAAGAGGAAGQCAGSAAAGVRSNRVKFCLPQ